MLLQRMVPGSVARGLVDKAVLSSVATVRPTLARTFGPLFALITLALMLLPAPGTYAQVTGATLTGTVSDPSGAAIPNAQLSIQNVATGETRTVSTDNAGLYSAPNLLPGRYDVTVTAPGFSTAVRTGERHAAGRTAGVFGYQRRGDPDRRGRVAPERA